MYQQDNSEILSLYAISPVHAGSGSSMGLVDLPIQRERHTNWPHIQASGVKGAMRHHFEKFKDKLGSPDEDEQLRNITEKIFGDSDYGDGTPGAIAISDAKLLAFPMRSSIAPFVWITCPAVLKRLDRDLKMTRRGNCCSGDPGSLLSSTTDAVVLNGSIPDDTQVLLEDYEVTTISSNHEQFLTPVAASMLNKAERLLLVSDEVFTYAVNNCAEVQAQIRIDSETGTTDTGSLRYEELLPADTVMYAVLFYGATKTPSGEGSFAAAQLIGYLKGNVIKSHMQIGGDETLGRGIFEIEWLDRRNQ